jgi:AcrR family transcriptional regulator
MTSLSLEGTKQLWGLYSLLPGLASALLYFYIIKSSALLKAMVFWDTETMAQVIEDAEASMKLGQEVRERMLQKLPNIAEPLKELEILFSQISSEGSTSLKRKEFQLLLNSLDIHFSRKKWALIFKEVDHNFDDEVSFHFAWFRPFILV